MTEIIKFLFYKRHPENPLCDNAFKNLYNREGDKSLLSSRFNTNKIA